MGKVDLGSVLLGEDRRAVLGGLAGAAVAFGLASTNVFGIPYPPVKVIAFYSLLSAVIAAANGARGGGLALSWAVVFAARTAAGADSLLLLYGIVAPSFLWMAFGPAIVFGTAGHALGLVVRRRLDDEPPGARILVGEPRTGRSLLVLTVAVVLAATALFLWRGESTVIGPVWYGLLGAALLATGWYAFRGGGLVGCWLPFATGGVPLVFAVMADASSSSLAIHVTGAMTVVTTATVPGTAAYGLGRLARRLRQRGPVAIGDRSRMRARFSMHGRSVWRQLAPDTRRQATGITVMVVLFYLLYGATVTPVLEPLPPGDLDTTSIRLERGPCNGSCPVYAVEICGDGTVHYLGYAHVETIGYRQYAVPRDRVRELVRLAYDEDFFRLRSWFTFPAFDLASTTTTVTIGRRSHTVYEYGGTGPARLDRFQRAVDAVSRPHSAPNATNEADRPLEEEWTC